MTLTAAAAAVPSRTLAPVPILMYHVINAPPEGAPYPGLFVPRDVFSAQVAWMARNGFHAVTLQQVLDAWRGAATLPHKPVVLSFDDGYLSHVTNALPVLRARRWPGVLNLEVANLEHSWGVSPAGVRKLISAGWEIDAHTLTHPDLTALTPARLREEVAGSRIAIQRRFGVPVNFFCYPAGRYDETVVAAVQEAGYLGATTTNYGLAKPSELYTLARIRVDSSDGVRGLADKLAAAMASKDRS